MNIQNCKLNAALTAFYAVTSGVSSIRCARVVTVLAALIVGTLFFTESFAATLPLASYTVSAAGSPEINVPGTVSGSDCNGSDGCETTYASASAGLAISIHGSGSGVNPADASGQGSITFYYEITGPGSVSVPLIISGSASTSVSGPNATANAYIEYGNGDLYTCSSTVAGACGSEAASGSLNLVRFTNESSNTPYDLGVIATGYSADGTGSFSAQISGFKFGIDPAWLASNPGYSLKFSSNINIAAVPEPDTYAMLLAGLGLLSFITTRRSKAEKEVGYVTVK